MLARLCCRCCLSVRPSVTTFTIRCVSKRLDRSGCFWAWMLPFAYSIHCTKEIQVGAYLKKQGHFPLDFVQNSGLRRFRHGKSIELSTSLVDGRALLSTHTTVAAPWLHAVGGRCYALTTHVIYYTQWLKW